MNQEFFRGDAECRRHLISQSERHFAASPNLGAARLIGFDDARVRLDIGLVHDLGLKSIFDDQIGAAKAVFDIAFFPGQLNECVTRRRKFSRQPLVLHDLRMKQRRARGQSFTRIEQGRQFLVLDVDFFQRLLGDFLGVGGHRRDLFASETHHPVGEHGHIVDLPANLDAFDIEACDNSPHSRQR